MQYKKVFFAVIYELTDDIKTMMILCGINTDDHISSYVAAYSNNVTDISHNVIFFHEPAFVNKLHSAFSVDNTYECVSKHNVDFDWEMGDKLVGYVVTSICTTEFAGEVMPDKRTAKKYCYMVDLCFDGDVNLTFRFSSKKNRENFLDFISNNTIEL